ncbi:ankyrin repeat-containing domain protein, partial [Phaeosphaeriaceae sp. PMI808]
SSSGWTPLHWCVTNEFKHSIDVVERLLASGADLNSHKGEESESPLVVAVKYGKMKNVEYLVQHGADMEAPDHWGKTPVIHAVLLNKPHILRVLLGSGANLKSVLPDGRTVLHCAASSAGPEVMELLAQSGGGVDLDAKDGI